MNTRDMKTQHKMTSTLLFLSRYVILGVENMRQTQKEFGDGMERKWKWKEVDYIHAHPLCLHSRMWKNGDHLKKSNDHSIFKIFFLKCLKSRHFYYTWLYRFIKKNWHSIYCDFWSVSGQKVILGFLFRGIFEPDVNRTRNLLIWSQTRYHCATDPRLHTTPWEFV